MSRTKDELEEVARDIEKLGRQAMVFPADTSDDKAMQDLFDGIRDRFGQLDFVFANAGVNGVWAPIDELTPDEWDKTIRINLRGTFLTIHFAVR